MAAFQIDFPGNFKMDPAYTPREQGDIPNLEYAILDFCERYSNSEWQFVIDQDAYKLWVDDIDYFWFWIPGFLQKINSGDPAVLGIMNQNHDILLKVEDHSQDLVVASLVIGDTNKRPFPSKQFPPDISNPQRIKIPRRDYVGEWWTFVEQVIAFLINDGLIDADDPSLEAYLKQMPPKPTSS